MKGSPQFKTGDKVRLKTGTSPIQVMEVDYFHCANAHTCPPSYKKARYGKTPMKGWYIRFQYFSFLAKVKSPKENKSKWIKFKGEPVTFGE